MNKVIETIASDDKSIAHSPGCANDASITITIQMSGIYAGGGAKKPQLQQLPKTKPGSVSLLPRERNNMIDLYHVAPDVRTSIDRRMSLRGCFKSQSCYFDQTY